MKFPQLPSLQPRERLLAVVGGMAVMVLLLDRAVLSPWLRQIRAVGRSITQMEERYVTNQQLMTRKDRVLVDLVRYQRYLRPPQADESQMAALLKEVEAIAADSHVTVGEVKPLATETTDAATRYALEIRFECTPEDWAGFIYHLETSPALFDVQRAGLSRKPDSQDQLEGTLRIATTVLQLVPARSPAPAGEPHAASP
ncbi:MAG: hypothetical protein HY737_08900 [Candidatus Omnitrophica bacterium]|nr:hypothetical protein [Candidatus Omnitrophota bacterium]